MPTGICGLYKNTAGAVENTYWRDIPVGRENAVTYAELCALWGCDTRRARAILHDLSTYDNGDNFILIRSGACKGFYKTDDESEIRAYKRECLSKGKSVFAPVKKINRVLNADDVQYSFTNNIRVVREGKGLTQRAVCEQMKKHDRTFDKSILSKIENGYIIPTYYQITRLAEILDCKPSDLLEVELFH